MKKNVFITLIVIILSILLGISSSNLGSICTTKSTYNQLMNTTEAHHIYYNIHPFTSNEMRNVSTYYNQMHYGTDDSIISKLEKTGVCSIYPYLGLYLYNSEIGCNGSFVIDGQEITIENTDPIVLIPYYPEDQLDDSNQKIFITSSLQKLLDTDTAGKEVTLKNLQIPVSQEQSVSKITYNDKTISEDCFNVNFIYQDISLKVDETIDYHFDLYDSSLGIMIPYSSFIDIINQYNENYTIPNYIVLTNQGSEEAIYKSLYNMNNEICVTYKYHNLSINSQAYNSTIKSTLHLNLVLIILSTIISIIIGRKIISSIEEKLGMFITLFICSELVAYMNIHTYNKYSLIYTLISVLVGLVFSLLLIKKETILFTGDYKECQQYVEEHHLHSYKIKRTNALLRLLWSGDMADSSTQFDRLIDIKQKYMVIKKG